jgi:hypothetical protein
MPSVDGAVIRPGPQRENRNADVVVIHNGAQIVARGAAVEADKSPEIALDRSHVTYYI